MPCELKHITIREGTKDAVKGAEAMFDILEYSYIVTLQSVLPTYYLLRNY